MTAHFISDLHLDERKPGINRILLKYLKQDAARADEIYLLGDIFEYWLGDDVSLSRYTEVCDALRSLCDRGIRLYFMRGNRDFLVDAEFSRTTGCKLLNDPQVIELNGEKALLSHGDMFCTDDVEHQKFRELVSQEAVRNRLLSLPAAQREQMALQIRGMSPAQQGAGAKSMEIMDVNQQSVERSMREYDVHLLIHGHTHRCAMHEFQLDGQMARRIVLSDWHEDRGNLLIADADGLRFQHLN